MGFISICTALYDYTPQGEGELSIQEGELIYILEKGDEDDWWKAKKKPEDEEDEEPIGLIPNNYVEEATPKHQARALYDYSRQTDEEISFSEDATLLVYDTSDPDWTLVGLDEDFGFAPANYIEIVGDAEEPEDESDPISPPLPTRPAAPALEDETASPVPAHVLPVPNPVANLASIIGGHAARTPIAPIQPAESPTVESEEEAPPPMPQRPVSQVASPTPQEESPRSPEPPRVMASPPTSRVSHSNTATGEQVPGGYHLYNVNEMVSVMGKQKKMPTTLGINLATGIILVSPEKKRDGPQQEWTAEKLSHYSIEGKHVFMELVRPSKSLDLHAGAKDTATEIVAALGELAGAVKAEGLREVIAAGTGRVQKKGQMLYDFMAQGDDEVTVADGDEVVILDDTLSEEWWKVRRVRNGKEGVVPSSYVEVTGRLSPQPQADSSANRISAGLSSVQRNRLEDEELTRQSFAASQQREREREEQELSAAEVGPGLKLPNRGSSLMADDHPSLHRKRGDSRADSKSAKSKPDMTKLRTWTDRSGSFKVEAQFIGLKDSKIHLHKVNGVKIAVPVSKMATVDLEYVERSTGVSLDEDKPLSDIKKRGVNGTDRRGTQPGSSQQPPSDYDWFDFFLKCGVSPYQCERYSQNFSKDSMDESVLPDIEPSVLRNLGLKEGDVLRVMKYLDGKYGRTGAKQKARNVSFGGEEVIGKEGGGEEGSGGLFSGPGGKLLNNTRKGRPAPAVQTNDTIDSKVFEQGGSSGPKSPPPIERSDSPEERPPKPPAKDNKFDDNAWDVKPVRNPSAKSNSTVQQPSKTASAPAAKPASPPPALTGSMADLSLLSQPLQPTVAHTTGATQQTPTQTSQPQVLQPQLTALPAINQTSPPPVQQQQPQPPQSAQQQGANPTFFSQLNQQPTGLPQQQFNTFSQPNQQLAPQQTGQFQFNAPRQRPLAPQITQQGPIMAPPPARPLSAPQNAPQQSSFQPPPLQPQLTGVPNQFGNMQNTSSPPNFSQMQQQQLNQAPQQMSQPTGFNPAQGFGQGINGFPPQQNGFSQGQQFQPQSTGFQNPGFSLNSQSTSTPFNSFQMQPQQTGYQSTLGPGSLQPQQTGINSILPPALQPQSTGINGFSGQGIGQQAPAVPQIPQQFNHPPPPIPQQPTAAPLQPQKTGPAPNVKFGVQPEAKKMMPQATGRRANLAHATPENPFGF